MIKILIALTVLSISSTNLYAATDVVAGEKKAGTCAGCHGAKGINKNAQFPILAGQKAAYIASQLRAFKKGTRINPMMQSMAKNLSSEDINNLAAYFSGLKNNTNHTNDIKMADDTASKASMCKGCHGSNAEGRGGFPRLANQHVKYLENQLKAFKSGDRKSSPMSGISKSLSDEDIKQLSVYMSSLNAEKK
ncbi:MAG: c-type cytochrome [Methylococcaceae bacterium]|nr:c-type cytochrome [Methylococcaceae bacterium]